MFMVHFVDITNDPNNGGCLATPQLFQFEKQWRINPEQLVPDTGDSIFGRKLFFNDLN
jgi:hypothetical protein